MAKKLSEYIREQKAREQAQLKRLLEERPTGSGYRPAPRNDEITSTAIAKKKPLNPLTAPAYETPEEEAEAMDKGQIPKIDKELPELLDMETEEENTANPRPRISDDNELNEDKNT